MSDSKSTQESTKPAFQKPNDNVLAFTRVYATDLDRAQKFYETVFSWKFQGHTDKVRVFFSGGQWMGAMHQKDDWEGAREGTILNYILVADVAEVLNRAKEAGGKVVEEKWNEGGHSDMGQFEDTEGNRWGLLHWLM